MFTSKTYYYLRILQAILPPKRVWNGVKAAVSYFFSKRGKRLAWRHLPLFISLEPSNVCNLHCPECPVGTRAEKVLPENIDLDFSVRWMDALSPTLAHVIFYFQGEPFMNPKFLELVRYARSKNILTSTSTNGQLIDNKRARQIVESGLDRLIISIDGTTQEVYEKYRVGGKLDKAVKAAEDIRRWKKTLKKPHPFVEIQFIVMRHNEHQISEIRALAKKLQADKVALKSAQIYDFENGSDLIPSIQKYARYKADENGQYRIKSPLKNSCRRLWNGAVINSKGDLLPCCFDKEGKYSFGNLKRTDFDDIWKGASAQNFRKDILTNRKQFDMCRNCTEK